MKKLLPKTINNDNILFHLQVSIYINNFCNTYNVDI